MEQNIVWKEAISNQELSDEDGWEEDENDQQEVMGHPHPIEHDEMIDSTIDRETREMKPETLMNKTSFGGNIEFRSEIKFRHNQLDLKLRRNIINLAEATQEKPKPNHSTTLSTEAFENWLENALVSISPNADCILFATNTPEKLVFLAKLKMEPIDQYATKTLEIPLDFDEYITSLLCLPVMSTNRTSLGAVDWTALVVGLSSGYIKFYTEQSICLLSLKFCDEPIIGLKCQTQKNNPNGRSQTHFASIVDELLAIYQTCAIMIDGITLFYNLHNSKNDVIKSNLCYEPAYTLMNLPTILNCVKVRFDEYQRIEIIDADLFAMRSTTRFDSLKSDCMNSDHIQAKACTRTIATIGHNPFLTFYREAKETTTHSYTEIITSFFPIWNKQPPTKMQMNELNQTSNICLSDKGRRATSIVASPDRRLAALTDDFGRVMLIDVTNCLVVRLWKGYRSAQCGWIEIKRDQESLLSPCATFLVIYAPKRGLLEIWSMQKGPRVAAFNVGRGCRILYSAYRMLNMIPSSKGPSIPKSLIGQSYSTNCYLLNPKYETIFTIELPYTYSLYKFGDLKSRDFLFIEELKNALKHDQESKIISEILHRIVSAEFIRISIEKIALNLTPEKIVPIMENLVNKIMKNYDNDSGESMIADDILNVHLSKRLILLCSMYNDLSKSAPSDITLPDVNQRLIDEYEEHPQEVDEFADQLNWTVSEVLRYLSLLALERSYRKNHQQNPWPSMGEPLTWFEFIGCFELVPQDEIQKISGGIQSSNYELSKLSIKLKQFNSKFLNEDKVVKTAIFMFNRLSESFYKSTMNSTKLSSVQLNNNLLNSYTYLEPTSRLALLFHFWLSTKLCNHWKMWAFLQDQVGRISDELKVIAMNQANGDEIMIETWNQVYKLILESDNIFAALIATASIKSDTLRTIKDDEKREKLNQSNIDSNNDDVHQNLKNADTNNEESKGLTIDWECLCIDAERMSMLSQQLEDLFLLNLLLKYSPKDGHLIESFIYTKVPRISVANILRGGPTIVSELVAQWVAQSSINLAILKQPYGDHNDEMNKIIFSGPLIGDKKGLRSIQLLKLKALDGGQQADEVMNCTNDDQVKELLHHAKTSFPHSLEPNILLLNCIWEFCRRWANGGTVTSAKSYLLDRALDSLSQLDSIKLKHNVASVVYKNFFQRTFERLAILMEANSFLLDKRSSKARDALTRRELNMSEDCLENFMQLCCDLSELMLETCRDTKRSKELLDTDGGLHLDHQDDEIEELFESLSIQDDWWTTPMAIRILNDGRRLKPIDGGSIERTDSPIDDINISARSLRANVILAEPELNSSLEVRNHNSIVRASLLSSSNLLLDVNTLVELNKLANLNNLIFKLKIARAYPLSLIGEESRQLLRFDLQQSPTTGADIKTRSGSLFELRQKFARKCIDRIVAEIANETNEITEEKYGFTQNALWCLLEDIDTSKRSALTSSGSGSGTATTIGNHDNEYREAPDDNSDDDNGNVAVEHKSSCKQLGSSMAFKQQQVTTATREIAASSNTSRPPEAKETNARQQNRATIDENNESFDHDHDESLWGHKSGESMLLFNNLLSLANEWHLDCDELNLEFVFGLYRCNLDKIAAQISTRVQDKQTLANGLLKIASQRVLLLFGLSPKVSNQYHWRRRIDKWSWFQPNVASWLKDVQEREFMGKIARLGLSDVLKPTDGGRIESQLDVDDAGSNVSQSSKALVEFVNYIEKMLGVQLYALNALRLRTKLILEEMTNYLEGQSERLAYDLLQVLSSKLFEEFLAKERQVYLNYGD